MSSNGIFVLCHFCEQHGPRVLFCTQSYTSLPSAVELLRGAGDCHCLFVCKNCRSANHAE